ncbi:unnamed protein product [Cuscuta campestris]|uniref:Receptor ligand binding region domain-containing protein n=1 Tax=Cuscuta campestris TaxID=132261 RepID=A0A484MZI3_9ASTE|nr:unnamed protein product [Cuscuta campestris]
MELSKFTQKMYWAVVFLGFYSGVIICGGVKPEVVNVGCMLILTSPVGRVTKLAVETAVEEVNSSKQTVLGGRKLNITTLDSTASGFLGIVEAIRFMETNTVAIIGPQSSVIAHVISHIANEVQVPLLSSAAADPTLTSLQFPFFVRTCPNDLFQMAAVASMVEHYEWRKVVAIYIDDDYGRNGIAALGDQLAMRRCQISYKAALKPEATVDDIRDALIQVALMESRVLVVHTYPDQSSLNIFSVAKSLKMMESGYVWITTHWLSTVFDTVGPFSPDTMEDIQGVVTLRIHTPDSSLKRRFISRFMNMKKTWDY